jgi:hypothetical protein
MNRSLDGKCEKRLFKKEQTPLANMLRERGRYGANFAFVAHSIRAPPTLPQS